MKFAFMCKKEMVQTAGPHGRGKIAIVGAGPAGLAAAGYLVCQGYEADVYDKLPLPGGLMTFAIPAFRVSVKSVVEGVEDLRDNFGVKFILNTKVFKKDGVRHDEGDEFVKDVIDLKELVDNYDAVLITSGTWRSRKMNIPGEDSKGVYTALEYLFMLRTYSMGYTKHSPPKVKKVVVVGGGLSAVDAAEESLLSGADEVYLVYRRTINEAPAGPFEINRLRRLGVKWMELATPKRIIADANGRVKGVELIRMKLGEPDESGRPRPIPIEGSEFTLEADTVIEAVGELPTPPTQEEYLGIKLDKRGRILVDEKYRTGNEKVFAAGDVVSGPSKIGNAVSLGLNAAMSVHLYLTSKRLTQKSGW